MIETIKLVTAAEINPKGPSAWEMSPDTLCDFVPMSAVGEDGKMSITERRPYREVSKGYTPFRCDDVLVAKITPCFENGKIALAKTSTEFAFGSTEFHVIRCRDRKLYPNYLLHFLRQERIRYEGEKRMTGSAGQKRVPRQFLEGLDLPVHSMVKQRRIAAILDRADSIRRKSEQALALADDFLKSVFLEMFGRPNRPNPKLKRLQLGKLCDLFAGNSLPTGEAYVGQDSGLLLLKVGDLNLPGNDQVVMSAREWVAEKGRTGAAIVAPKDAIVFPKRGGAIATNKKRVLGRSCILDPNLMAVAPKQDAPISYPFLRVWFELLDLASISNGSTVPQLNKGDLAPLELPVPAKNDRIRFDNLFHSANKIREKKSGDMTSAETLFSALSQRAFRGEL